jgi:hypothetical protein
MRHRHPLIALVLALAAAAGCTREAEGDPDGGADLASDPFVFDLSCASTTQKAELKPLNLLVLLDRSGSMGDGVNGDRTLKWDPVTAGLTAFFAAPASQGVFASLHLFPFAGSDVCNPSAYYSATVPLTALPATAFSGPIAAATPGGNTPTRPAILGVIDLARELKAKDPATATAIVLVTDGEPDFCNSSVDNVAFEVQKVAPGIPTYVIAVGQSLAGLVKIAEAAGTAPPTVVSVGDAMKTRDDFLAALEAIRGLQLTCNLPLPAPPAGQSLDLTRVNVLFTSGAGAAQQLVYDRDCSSGSGWRYDDPAAPTRIELCGGACASAKADRRGRLDVVIGCKTDGDLIL